ncbi:unnamed protein product, partial [Coccothraustes coccothraustes]
RGVQSSGATGQSRPWMEPQQGLCWPGEGDTALLAWARQRCHSQGCLAGLSWPCL